MEKRPAFIAAQFTATESTTAEEKAKWLSDLTTWAWNGFSEKGFTERFYRGFHVYMAYSAETNKRQFYCYWFANNTTRLDWLNWVLEEWPLGHPEYTWSDVARELKGWIRNNNMVTIYQQKINEAKEAQERAQQAYLKAKYEPGEK